MRVERILGLSLTLVALLVYVVTMAPTVGFIDSGELATVASTLGIAHPTGYPVFTLLAHLFTLIPLGMRTITQLNLFAALLCASSLYFYFGAFVMLGKYLRVAAREKGRDGTTPWEVLIPAALATLLLGFSETFWSQALAIEVYPLHLLFLSLLLYLFVRGMLGDMGVQLTPDGPAGTPHGTVWLLFAFVLGLAFTNHMTTILLAPAFLYLFFAVNGFSARTWRRLYRMAVPFLLGFSVQIYLLVRAANHPVVNWGNPSTIERFLWHFGGKVYRVWFFSSTESAMRQLTYFVDTLPGEFAYLPLLLAAVGCWQLFRLSKQLGIFVLLLFVGCVGYSINYDIHDIDSYFLLAYIAIGIWIATGGMYVVARGRGRMSPAVMAVIAGVSVVGVLLVQKPKVDESSSTIVEAYTREVLGSVEPNSVVISYQWDYFVSASYYLQIVEGVRPDVTVIDKELLRRTWYFDQLRHRYPELVRPIESEVDAFLKELYKFEHDLPYSGAVIEERYKAVIRAIIRSNIGVRNVYVTPEIEPEYTSGFTRYPHGLTFRLSPPGIVPDVVNPDFVIPAVARSNKYTDGILSMYAQGYYFHAQYALGRGRREDAMQLVERALAIRPEYREAIFLKSKIIPSGD